MFLPRDGEGTCANTERLVGTKSLIYSYSSHSRADNGDFVKLPAKSGGGASYSLVQFRPSIWNASFIAPLSWCSSSGLACFSFGLT